MKSRNIRRVAVLPALLTLVVASPHCAWGQTTGTPQASQQASDNSDWPRVGNDAGATRSAYHPALEAQSAFQVSGSVDVLLYDVQAYDVYGDGRFKVFGSWALRGLFAMISSASRSRASLSTSLSMSNAPRFAGDEDGAA